MTIRAGLVGCGFFARNHAHAWAELDGVELAAVADLDEARAHAFASDFGVPASYGSIGDMLSNEGLDFVDIVTQAPSHAALVSQAAEAGVAIICQKPLAASLEEAREIVAKTEGVRLMVHENFRWQRPMRLLKEVAAEIGELFYAQVSFRSGYDVYARQPYLATDKRFIVYDLGVHLFDLARFFSGEAARLACHTRRVNPDIRAEDVATGLIETRGGAHVVVDMSYASRLERELFPQTLVRLEGSKGSAVLSSDYRITASTPAGVARVEAAPVLYRWSTPPSHAVQDSVVAIQRHWLECLRSGRTPETSGEDNLRTLELAFGAYRSAAEGRTVEIGS